MNSIRTVCLFESDQKLKKENWFHMNSPYGKDFPKSFVRVLYRAKVQIVFAGTMSSHRIKNPEEKQT